MEKVVHEIQIEIFSSQKKIVSNVKNNSDDSYIKMRKTADNFLKIILSELWFL